MKYILVKENVQKARKILKKLDKTEEDPSFKKIKEIVGDQLGFLGLFTHLHFIEEERMGQLSTLIDMLKRHKKVLHKLPKEVVNYKSSEILMDDLLVILKWEKYNKTFVSRLNGKLKLSAREDKELYSWVSNASEEEIKDLNDNFLPKVARYNNYTEFKNDVNNFLNKSYNSESILKSIDDQENTYLKYNKDGIIVAEVFAKQDSCEIGSSSWCISGNKGTYWDQYAGIQTGNKQYFLWNLNVPSRDINSQVGVTIEKSGEQRSAHLKNDDFVKIDKYCEEYNIPRNVFSPLSKEDAPKLVKANEMNIELAQILNKMGVASEYKDLMDIRIRMILGMLTDEELSNYGELDKYKFLLYKEKKNDILHSLMYYLNNIDYSDDTADNDRLEVNENLEYIIKSFSFTDKLYYLKKYQGKFNSWEKSDNNMHYLDDDGLSNFFRKDILEISEDRDWDLEIEIDSRTDIINFEFKGVDGSEYAEIHGLDEDTIHGLHWLDSSDFLYSDDDEWRYIFYGFTDKTKDKLREYLNYIKGGLFHPDQMKDVDELIKNINENGIYDMDEFINILSSIDPKFGEYHGGYIGEYMDILRDHAQDLVNKDIKQWDDDKVGEHDNNNKWTVEYDDILNSMEIKTNYDGDQEELDGSDVIYNRFETLVKWVDSEPGSLSANYIFDDYPHSSSYLSQADSKESNEKLIELLDESINGENEDLEDNIDDNKSFKETHISLLNKGYIPISAESNYRNDGNWYGYKSNPIDLKKTIKVEIESEEDEKKFKEVPTKSIRIIPLNQISRMRANIYTVNMDIESHGSLNDWGSDIKIRDLTERNKENLEKIGVIINDVDLDNFIHDGKVPNQLELELESKSHLNNIKSFKDFI